MICEQFLSLVTDPSLFISFTYLYQHDKLSPVHNFISGGAIIRLRERRLGLHTFHSVEYFEHGVFPSYSGAPRIYLYRALRQYIFVNMFTGELLLYLPIRPGDSRDVQVLLSRTFRTCIKLRTGRKT